MRSISQIRLVFILFFLVVSNYSHCFGQNPEKILLQIDRDIYFAGEDVLVRGLLLTNDNIQSSKVLYIEVFDTDNNIIEQAKFEIVKGIAFGRINLSESIPTQNYLIRAYTNYQKNFSPEIYPTKVFAVINPHVPVNSNNSTKDQEKIKLTLSHNNILITQDTTDLTFEVTNVKNIEDYKFVLYSDAFEQVSLIPILSSQPVSVSKQDIPAGMCYLALNNGENKLVAVRPFFNWPKENGFDIQLTKTEFKPREKVELSIQNKDFFESVSVFVVKKGTVDFNTIPSNILNNYALLNTYLLENHSVVRHLKDTIDFYLERAGIELFNNEIFSECVDETGRLPKKYAFEPIGTSLSGKVLTENNIPLKDVRLYLSVFNGKQQFHSTRSDSLGNFSFSLYPKTYGDNRLIVRAESKDSIKAKILLDYDYSTQHAENSVRIEIDSTDRTLLEELYVNHQIYKRINSVVVNNQNDTSFSMFGMPRFSIKLDEYINLPKLEEVFSEIVPLVSVKRKKGKPYLSIFNERVGVYYNSPLVLLDFIPIYNIETLLEINPSSIYKIDVFNSSYRLGEFNYHGIVSISTRKNNFAEFPFPSDVAFFDFKSFSFQYDFNHVNHSVIEKKLSHIPDFRTVLYWCSNLKSNTISFSASDHCSEYQILITGVDMQGYVAKSSCTIKVKQ